MKRILLLTLIIVAIPLAVTAQRFPDSFIGYWKGSLDIYSGANVKQTVTCALEVFPADSGRYDWIITYGDSGQDRRHYMLIPVDTAKGHWAIDEQNGIVIDLFATGNKMTSLFTIMGSAIQISYWLEGEDLVMELFTYPEKADTLTGKGTEESPEVKVFKFTGYQLGRMKKMKGMRRSLLPHQRIRRVRFLHPRTHIICPVYEQCFILRSKFCVVVHDGVRSQRHFFLFYHFSDLFKLVVLTRE